VGLQDLLFDGGVVQVIDALLIPPTGVADTANSFNVTAFEGALYTSGIIGAAQAAPDVTIFAAANSGFQALGPAITSMTSQELTKVLDYTILPQVVYSTELTGGAKFRTLNGENITITAEGNNVYVDSAQLIQTDILIANGVMHIIDNVLNPQAINNPPNPKIGTQVPVFASASMVTDLPFTNSVPCTSCQASTIVSNSEPTTPAAANASGSPTSLSSSSSKARAAIAKETGFGAVGIMAALGGAVLMV
jgi:transforming growth factor-beta-induced protein